MCTYMRYIVWGSVTGMCVCLCVTLSCVLCCRTVGRPGGAGRRKAPKRRTKSAEVTTSPHNMRYSLAAPSTVVFCCGLCASVHLYPVDCYHYA